MTEPHRNRELPAPDDRGAWRVVRQDDNGQGFTVARAATRERAQAIADELEARGHKQMYWVEPDP